MADIHNLDDYRTLKRYITSLTIDEMTISKHAATDIVDVIGPVLVCLLKQRGVENKADIQKFLSEILRLYTELIINSEYSTVDALKKALVSNSKIS